MNIDIKVEQQKAQESINQQGLRVLVCAGTGCVANGSMKVIEKFKELGADVSTLTEYDKMTIVPTGCHGFCEQGVLVIIPDKHVTYVKVKETDVEEIYELLDRYLEEEQEQMTGQQEELTQEKES